MARVTPDSAKNLCAREKGTAGPEATVIHGVFRGHRLAALMDPGKSIGVFKPRRTELHRCTQREEKNPVNRNFHSVADDLQKNKSGEKIERLAFLKS